MDISTLAKMQDNLKKIASSLTDQEDLLIVPLVNKMQKLAEYHPTDPTIVSLYRFLVKRAQDSMVIKRRDLKEAYGSFNVSHSVAHKYLADELMLPKMEETKNKIHRQANEGEPIQLNVDQDLVEQMKSLVGEASYRPYTEDIAKRAIQSCAHELCYSNTMPNNISVLSGDQDLIICRASYNTAKGECSVLIPIEIQKNCALTPSSFITTEGFKEISEQNISEYLQKTAGQIIRVDGNKILKYCRAMRVDSDAVDRAVVMAKAQEVSDALTVFASQPIEEPTNVDPQLQSISNMLGSIAGSAEFTLGKDAVNISRQLVINKLATLGYDKADVTISNFDKENILFAVGIGKYAFTVPVYLKNSKAIVSDVIIANGGMHEFSTRGLYEMFKVGEVDVTAMVKSSQIDSMSPAEVVGIVRKEMLEGNYEKAVAALEWLKEAKDERAYASAIDVYKKGLRGDLVKEACSNQSCGCSAPIKSAHSIHLICSHLGLPVTQVCQDEKGRCQPLYRKRMQESYDGFIPMTSKIFI